MSDERTETLNHFGTYRFTREFWSLSGERRATLFADLVTHAREMAAAHSYQLTPMETDADILVWSATAADGPEAPRTFFRDMARTLSPFRSFVQPRGALWGFTRRSRYSKAKSAREIDPLVAERAPYLVAYPFTKTVDWYLLDAESRQTMMNEHIRVGKQYRDISQLLLYSVGLQDQEFVVVYETDDLTAFSDLVRELRATEARRFTQRDTPIHTAILCPPDELDSVWAGS